MAHNVLPTPFLNERRGKNTEIRTHERSFGAASVFRVITGTPTIVIASTLPRPERWLLLLMDGRRSLADLAHLTRRSEFAVATTLASFLHQGYIELVSVEQFKNTHGER